MSDNPDRRALDVGEFPFPLIDGPDESRHLTWLRNNSNYMVTRGSTDYLRIIAILVRGIVINLLILATPVLLIAVLFGWSYFNLTTYFASPDAVEVRIERFQEGLLGKVERFEITTTITRNDGNPVRLETEGAPGVPLTDVAARHLADIGSEADTAGGKRREFSKFSWIWLPGKILISDKAGDQNYVVPLEGLEFGEDNLPVAQFFEVPDKTFLQYTLFVLAGSVLWVLFFPVLTRLYRIVKFKPTLDFDPGGSVKIRDWLELSYAYLLLFILGFALIEGFPLLLVYFHKLRAGTIGVGLPTFAGITGAVIAANRVLPHLSGYARQIAILVVGILGLMIPLLGVLIAAEFLVFADAVEWNHVLVLGLLGLPLVLFVGLLLSMVLGVFKGTLGLRGGLKLLGVAAFLAVLFAVVLGCYLYIYFGGLLVPEWDTNPAAISDLYANYFVVIGWAVVIWVFCRLVVDVNLTSISGLYRDRLVHAYLVGKNDDGDIEVEKDVNLHEICNYDARSVAPYHLINAALNLQGSKDPAIRDRNSDFFIFSRRFIGGARTGYCASEDMELAFPQMDLGTAMAISAAAASPNMGRGTNPLMVAFMTLLNVRLGYWVPNPGKLAGKVAGISGDGRTEGHSFHGAVFPTELKEIAKRRVLTGGQQARALGKATHPTTGHNLVGIAFSGGGIRSATLNLGIAQALYQTGIFGHADYLSTVSGGGYTGASISAAMRHKTQPYSQVDGVAEISAKQPGTVRVTPAQGAPRNHEFGADAEISALVRQDRNVRRGQWLLQAGGSPGVKLIDVFNWRVRPAALRNEMLSRLDETHKWVNLSDGGHIENMAAIELLRRRCRFIIIGDGEADQQLHFAGLATLLRFARIDLGIRIDIDVSNIRPRAGSAPDGGTGISNASWAHGTIHYPNDEKTGTVPETGHLLYLKSSLDGHEGTVVREYRDRNPTFPHQTTADQLFNEAQFEAYRALGEHIARSALQRSPVGKKGAPMSFADLERWFTKTLPAAPPGTGDGRAKKKQT